MCAIVNVHHKLINAISVKMFARKAEKASLYVLPSQSHKLRFLCSRTGNRQCITRLLGSHWSTGSVHHSAIGFTLVPWFSAPLTYWVHIGSMVQCTTHLLGSHWSHGSVYHSPIGSTLDPWFEHHSPIWVHIGPLVQCTTHLFGFFGVTFSLYHSPIRFFWVTFSVYHSPIYVFFW